MVIGSVLLQKPESPGILFHSVRHSNYLHQLAPPVGLEPTAFGLGSRCTIHCATRADASFQPTVLADRFLERGGDEGNRTPTLALRKPCAPIITTSPRAVPGRYFPDGAFTHHRLAAGSGSNSFYERIQDSPPRPRDLEVVICKP